MGHEVLDSLPFPRGQTAQSGITLSSPTGDGSRVSQMASGAINSATSPLYDSDSTSGSQFRPDLAGKIYSVRDTHNGTNRPMLLRCIQLYCRSGGSEVTPGSTVLTVQTATSNPTYGVGTGMQMGHATVPAIHGRHGVVAYQGGYGNTAPTAAEPSKPLDDSYAAGTILKSADYVYVVEEGPCRVPVLSGQTVTVGKEAAQHGDGSFRDAGNGESVVGTWLSVSGTSGSTNSTYGVLLVKRGYQGDKTGA